MIPLARHCPHPLSCFLHFHCTLFVSLYASIFFIYHLLFPLRPSRLNLHPAPSMICLSILESRSQLLGSSLQMCQSIPLFHPISLSDWAPAEQSVHHSTTVLYSTACSFCDKTEPNAFQMSHRSGADKWNWPISPLKGHDSFSVLSVHTWKHNVSI